MKHSVKSLSLVLLFLALSSQLHAMSGEELYKKANCQDCHGLAEQFDAKKNKVQAFHSLVARVHTCSEHFETGWFPEDEKKVVEYLNETHYKFKNQ